MTGLVAKTDDMTTVDVGTSEDSPARAPALRPRRLLGRQREFAEITESVLSWPVTTVIGPGGVGKTALATTEPGRCKRFGTKAEERRLG